jgi:hypothetical protein
MLTSRVEWKGENESMVATPVLFQSDVLKRGCCPYFLQNIHIVPCMRFNRYGRIQLIFILKKWFLGNF